MQLRTNSPVHMSQIATPMAADVATYLGPSPEVALGLGIWSCGTRMAIVGTGRKPELLGVGWSFCQTPDIKSSFRNLTFN